MDLQPKFNHKINMYLKQNFYLAKLTPNTVYKQLNFTV